MRRNKKVCRALLYPNVLDRQLSSISLSIVGWSPNAGDCTVQELANGAHWPIERQTRHNCRTRGAGTRFRRGIHLAGIQVGSLAAHPHHPECNSESARVLETAQTPAVALAYMTMALNGSPVPFHQRYNS